MGEVKVLVLTGYGLNCDYETTYAFQLAGANAVRVHINSLIDGSVKLENFQILVLDTSSHNLSKPAKLS